MPQTFQNRLFNLEQSYQHQRLNYGARKLVGSEQTRPLAIQICNDDASCLDPTTLEQLKDVNSDVTQIAMYAGCSELPKLLLANNVNIDVLNLAVLAGNEDFVNYMLQNTNVEPNIGTLYKAYIADNTNLINLLQDRYHLTVERGQLDSFARERGYLQILERLAFEGSGVRPTLHR